MDNDELAALLQDEERRAVAFRDTELAEEQEAALDYYEGKPFGDEEEGRSQVVAPDVAEVVDYMTISVLRTCVSGDRVVEFEAREQDFEQAAADATEAVNYMFMRGQNGYKILTDWLQSGLIEKIGVVKTARITEQKRTVQRATVGEDELAALVDEGLVKASSEIEPGIFDVQIETVEQVNRFVDMPVPSEEFIFASRTRDIDDLGYKAHRTRKTLSELIEMGFDRDMVESLPASDRANSIDQRENARWDDEEYTTESNIPSLRRVWLLEEYVNLDLNDDGIAELVQVFRVGRVILSLQEVDENPFAVFCPFPRAHRMVGNSLADKVMDLQRIRSIVLRNTLDGMYLSNNPRWWLPDECQNENTIDDLLTVRPGSIIRGRGAAGKPEPIVSAFDLGQGLNMLEYLVGERESRTGITRLNQGLDADALNKTATGTALMQAQGQQIEEFIARNFAEAMARLLMKKLRLMIAAGEPLSIRVEGQYRQVQPAEWTGDMDVSVRVGVGSGRKDQRLAYRQELLGIQREGLMAGLVTPKHVFNNVSAMIRDASLGNPLDYWPDPEAEGYEPVEQPDPAAQKLEAEKQIQAAKLEASREENALKLQLQREEAMQKQQLAREEAEFEAQLAVEKMEREYALAGRKMLLDTQLAAKQAEDAARMSQNRPGGDLDK